MPQTIESTRTMLSRFMNTPAIHPIEAEEHEHILDGLHKVEMLDLGEVTIRTGVNALGKLIVLLNTMSGVFAVVSIC